MNQFIDENCNSSFSNSFLKMNQFICLSQINPKELNANSFMNGNGPCTTPLLSQSLREVAAFGNTKFLLFTFSEQTQHLTLNQPAWQLYTILLGPHMKHFSLSITDRFQFSSIFAMTGTMDHSHNIIIARLIDLGVYHS